MLNKVIDEGMHTEDGKIFVCDCGGEALVVEVEEDDELWDGYVNIAMWQLGKTSYYGWRDKLRFIWFIIKYGHPYTDSIVIEKEKFKEFKRFIRGIKL